MTRVRLHTTISKTTEEKILKLENRFGTKSKVVETAISALEKAETVGSCDDCPLKEENSYRIILDLISMREDMLDRIMNIIFGELDFQTFFNDLRKRAKEEAFLFSQAISFKKRNDFQSMVKYLKMWEQISNHITILQIFESEHVVLMRIRSFQKIPEIVLEIIRGHLEGLEITFELDLGLDNLLKIKWISPELAMISKVSRDMDQKLNVRYNEVLKRIKPHTYMKNMLPINWELFNYLTEKTQNEMIPMDLGLNQIKYILGLKLDEIKEGDELDIFQKLLTYYEDVNYLTILNISQEKKKIFVSFKCQTDSILHLLIQLITFIVSRISIKLIETNIDQTSVMLTFENVKKDDPEIFNLLIREYFLSDLAPELIQTIIVPKELLRKLNNEIFNKNINSFKKIYKLIGTEIGNAISIYCKKKNLVFGEIVISWINQFLKSKDCEINIKNNVVTILYISPELPTIDAHKNLIEGLFSKVSKKVKIEQFENMLSITT